MHKMRKFVQLELHSLHTFFVKKICAANRKSQMETGLTMYFYVIEVACHDLDMAEGGESVCAF